ncbi:MAG: shikimate kinase [Gemmatimonadaceae bacterium]
MKHLVLVGLPGAGKTTIGRAAAAQAGLPFLDFDEEIGNRTGLSPSELFEQRGEQSFRAEELALSRELVGRHTIVVSPGGGWITQAAAREALRSHAWLVYLKVSPAAAAARLGRSASKRPLLAGEDPVVALGRLLAGRRALYESADQSVDTEVIDMQDVTEVVAEAARRCLAAPG